MVSIYVGVSIPCFKQKARNFVKHNPITKKVSCNNTNTSELLSYKKTNINLSLMIQQQYKPKKPTSISHHSPPCSRATFPTSTSVSLLLNIRCHGMTTSPLALLSCSYRNQETNGKYRKTANAQVLYIPLLTLNV